MGSRLVALGGGTGLASLLLSIKYLSRDALTAIVQQDVLLLPDCREDLGCILSAPLPYEGAGGLIRHDRGALSEMVLQLLEEKL